MADFSEKYELSLAFSKDKGIFVERMSRYFNEMF